MVTNKVEAIRDSDRGYRILAVKSSWVPPCWSLRIGNKSIETDQTKISYEDVILNIKLLVVAGISELAMNVKEEIMMYYSLVKWMGMAAQSPGRTRDFLSIAISTQVVVTTHVLSRAVSPGGKVVEAWNWISHLPSAAVNCGAWPPVQYTLKEWCLNTRRTLHSILALRVSIGNVLKSDYQKTTERHYQKE
jgi:hypothetical protein